MNPEQLKEGAQRFYGLRSRMYGTWVCVRKEQNPENSYACGECSHYAYLSHPLSSSLDLGDSEVWLLRSKDAILDCLTKDTQYYNAWEITDPVIEFDMEKDGLEIVEVEQTISLKLVPHG